MSDEPRLPPLPAEALELLEVERARPLPEPEQLTRVYGKLAIVLGLLPGPGPGGPGSTDPGATPPPISDGGLGAAGTGAAGAAAAGAGKASILAGLLKPAALVTFALGAATGVGTTLVVQRSSVPDARQIATRPDPAAVAATVAPPVTPDAPSVARPALASALDPAPRRRADPTAAKRFVRVDAGTPDERLAAERVLVERARSALARGRQSDALVALREHRKRFKDGQLAEEREALTVAALASQGESEQARATADRFRKRYPKSLLLPAVSAALEAGQPGQVGDRERPTHLP